MITPFTPDGSAVSLDVTDQYVQFLIEKGVNGVFVAGTTGEGLLLSVEERIALLNVARVRKTESRLLSCWGC